MEGGRGREKSVGWWCLSLRERGRQGAAESKGTTGELVACLLTGDQVVPRRSVGCGGAEESAKCRVE